MYIYIYIHTDVYTCICIYLRRNVCFDENRSPEHWMISDSTKLSGCDRGLLPDVARLHWQPLLSQGEKLCWWDGIYIYIYVYTVYIKIDLYGFYDV